MVDLLNECVYKKNKQYTFIEQLFLNNNKKLVYCLIAKDKDNNIDCLLQSLKSFSNKDKDNIINYYLDCKSVL